MHLRLGREGTWRRTPWTGALLDAHNSKEEPILYTQADAILSEEAGSELADFLARGMTPKGWVCSAATG